MTTKTTKANKTSKKNNTLSHIALAGKGGALCGAKGKTAALAQAANCAACQKVAAHAEEKARAAKAESKPAEKPETKKAAKSAPAPRERDPRLPPVGTVLVKRDRTGATRCEATIEAEGIRYNGTLFGSLSGAAMAAAKDLGLGDTAINGWLWWGIGKQARVTDPIELLQTAWDRFHERANRAFATAKDDDAVRTKLQAALAGQVKKLEQLAQAQ